MEFIWRIATLLSLLIRVNKHFINEKNTELSSHVYSQLLQFWWEMQGGILNESMTAFNDISVIGNCEEFPKNGLILYGQYTYKNNRF